LIQKDFPISACIFLYRRISWLYRVERHFSAANKAAAASIEQLYFPRKDGLEALLCLRLLFRNRSAICLAVKGFSDAEINTARKFMSFSSKRPLSA
jgi:hypothetical protein